MALAVSINEMAKALAAADDFLLLTHRRPDGDTVGAAAALCAGLRKLGKRAYLLENPEVSPKLEPYFSPYVRPEGYEGRHVVTTDISSHSQLPTNGKPYADKIDFLIDHHQNNDLSARYRCIDTEAAATSELVFSLISAMNIPLDKEIAALLYIGIATDTGCFKYANTRAETHRQAAVCIEQGIDVSEINKTFFSTKRRARVEMERLAYQNLRFDGDGRIASLVITQEMRAITGVTEDDLDDFSSIPSQIEGVLVGITGYEMADGSTKLSVRTTTDQINAATLCAVFGGGGHARAAGCTISLGTPFEAIEKMVAEAGKALEGIV